MAPRQPSAICSKTIKNWQIPVLRPVVRWPNKFLLFIRSKLYKSAGPVYAGAFSATNSPALFPLYHGAVYVSR